MTLQELQAGFPSTLVVCSLDLLFHLQCPGKTVPTRVNISKSTIPIQQVYLGERELERSAYSNLQKPGRPVPG